MMDYRQLFKEIDRGQIRPIYLFYGEERYLQEEAVRRILDRTVEPSRRGFNYHSFSGKEVLANTLIEVVTSPPFSAQRRLVLIREADLVSSTQQEKLLPYCQRPCPASSLILTATKKSFIPQLFQEISRLGAVVEFSFLPTGEVMNWILNRAKGEGCRISPPAARYLLEGTGNDLLRVQNELLKAVSYVGEKGSIELTDVQAVSPPSSQSSVFSLSAALADKDLSVALSSLHFLVRQNEPLLVILTMIARHFRQVWQAKCFKEKGYGTTAISRELGMPPFRVEKLVSQSGKFSHGELRRVWDCLLETDKSLKSSALQDKLILEGLLFELCLGET